jgi:hypothetical protein
MNPSSSPPASDLSGRADFFGNHADEDREAVEHEIDEEDSAVVDGLKREVGAAPPEAPHAAATSSPERCAGAQAGAARVSLDARAREALGRVEGDLRRGLHQTRVT